MLTHNRLHFLGQCLGKGAFSLPPPQTPAPIADRWLGAGLRYLVNLRSHDGLRQFGYKGSLFFFNFCKGALPWCHRKQQRLLFSLLQPLGEAETTFTCIILFRVVFEVTFKRIKHFKKGCPPCHTRGELALLSTRRKEVL